MDTVRLVEPGRLERFQSEEPAAPGPGQALVQVRSIGICGTDVHAFFGRQPFFDYPRILGHELGVEVLAVGEGVADLPIGARCAVLPYLECGTCVACRRGRPNCCANLQVMGVHIDGGMRERMLVPADKLFFHPDLTFDQLALVETLGIGAHAVARAGIEAGETVLVVGLGPIGLGALQAARARGAHVVAVDAAASRLRFARDVFGVEQTFEAGEDLETRLMDALGGDLPTAVLDATGHPGSMNLAPTLCAPSGRVVFVGLHKGDVQFPDALFHRRELTLMASRNGTAAEFREVLDGMARGAIDTAPWITHETRLDRIADDLPLFADPASGVLKAVLRIDA
ncbi:MAG: zinc-binding alcohol dehydrogenase family protein [Planctomycetota bacterium]|jgi:threonine dehydrogenase-like Zn-dependent dehydrogenase